MTYNREQYNAATFNSAKLVEFPSISGLSRAVNTITGASQARNTTLGRATGVNTISGLSAVGST